VALVEQDFTIEQGSTFILQFNLTQDDGKPLTLADSIGGSTLYSIGRYRFRTKFRRSKYRGESSFSLSSTTLLQLDETDNGNTMDGFYIITETPGTVRLVLTPPTTEDIKYGKYFYDIEAVNYFIDSDGNTAGEEVTKVLSGRMAVIAEATT
jgi:hypothetical protein